MVFGADGQTGVHAAKHVVLENTPGKEHVINLHLKMVENHAVDQQLTQQIVSINTAIWVSDV